MGQQKSDSDCGAFDHASHAPQSLSDNYYVSVCVYKYTIYVCVCGWVGGWVQVGGLWEEPCLRDKM